MRVLLDALRRGPLLSTGRVALAILSASLLVVAGLATRREAAVCAGSDAAWGTVFAPADADAVRRAFAATGDASADFSFDLVKRGLDAYRAAWAAKHRETCEATRVRGTQSEALLDRRMVCLEARRKQAAGLVAVLAAADGRIVQNTRAALDALPPIASCDATAQLVAKDAPPAEPDKRAELARLEGELMQAAARFEADQWVPCLQAARAVLPAARALGYRPLEARARLVEGECQMHTPPRPEASAILHDAARLALLSRDDATVADAWIALMRALAFLDRNEEAASFAGYAEAAVARLGGDDDREGLRLQFSSNLLSAQGKLVEAEAEARRSIALLTKVYGPDDYRVANSEEILSIALFEQDRMEETYARHRHVIAARTRAFGPDNGSLQMALINEAEDVDVMGRPAEAVPLLRAALARWPAFEQGYAGYGHGILANALRHAGSYVEALAEDLAALEWLAREQGPASSAAAALAGAGLDYLALGHPREAVTFLERSLAANPAGVAGAHFGLARALRDSGGDRRRARDEAAKARAAVQARAARYGGRFKKDLETIDAWLASHPP
jgi:tetratricopeptide (TPR) repeat protein